MEEKGIVKIQSFIKRWKAKRAYKQFKKKMNYRYFVIKEILSTEENFIRDLHVINDLKETLTGQLQNYHMGIFQNIEEIISVNSVFNAALQKNFQGFFPQKSIFHIELKNFEKYFEYCNGYSNSTKLLKDLIQVHQDTNFMEYLKMYSPKFRGMQLEDFLVKPIQRLPKYVLLFQDLYKHTPEEHVDRNAILNILEYFKSMNEQNNQNMDKNLNRLQVKEIAEQLGDMGIYALNEKRYFCYQESVYIIQQDEDISGRGYFFSDLVVLSAAVMGKETILKMIILDQNSQIKLQDDTKNFKNLYSLVGQNGVIQFRCDSIVNKEKQIKQLNQLLEYSKSKAQDGKFLIQVRVIGTEERNTISLSKYTVYITEIQIERIVLKIYMRYSEIIQCSQYFKSIFKNLQLEEFSNKQWLTNHKTKVIEQRQLSIETLLQTVLSQQEAKEHVEMLRMLTLPLDFFDLPNLNQQLDLPFRNERKQINSLSGMLQRQYEEECKMKINISHIIETISYNKYDLQKDTENMIKFEVTLPDDTSKIVYVTQFTRAAEVVKILAEMLELKFHRDYRLFVIDSQQNKKIIDEDEIIDKIIIHQEKKGFLTKSIGRIESYMAGNKLQTFLFAKYIYLPPEMEEFDLISDPIRFGLFVDQIFYEVRNQKYCLEIKEYCLYASLYFKIKRLQLTQQEIQKFIPKSLYKEIPPNEWLEHIKGQITRITKDILQFISETKSESYLCQYMVFKSLAVNQIVGMALFYVEIQSETITELKKLNKQHPNNTYIGVSLEGVFLLTVQNKEIFHKIQFCEIERCKSFPNNLQIEGNGSEWKFGTLQSYEIKSIVLTYSKLQQFIQQQNQLMSMSMSLQLKY